MKNVDLYVRVSTDEQADKGYSQRDQEERLRRYCEINSFKVNMQIVSSSYQFFRIPQKVDVVKLGQKSNSTSEGIKKYFHSNRHQDQLHSLSAEWIDIHKIKSG